MKEPIIVSESGSVDIFETVEKAELYVEPIDVKNDEYIFYGADGELLLATVFKQIDGTEKAKISSNSKVIYQRTELKQLLKLFLRSLNHSTDELENMNLSELVKKASKYMSE